ncbi:galactose-1-phosphate uridylyltransferase [Candidatus Omnitrophota bacterium]
MHELRRDPVTGRWIIVYLENIPKPSEFAVEPTQKNADGCPFCMGAEQLTPPEIIAHRKKGGANTPGWTVRVVPNKYPALKAEGGLGKKGLGMFDMMNGIGAHEVIVETPDHFKDIADLSYRETEEMLWAYISRSVDLRKDPRFKYILLFKNYGRQAGASLEHSHTQLIALPIVPKRVKEELSGASRYFDYKDRCVFCDILRQELEYRDNILMDNKSFLAFCPFVSRFPYEVWVVPKAHIPEFTDIRRDAIGDLARALRDSLYRIKHLLSDPPYNFIIHTAPINAHEEGHYHWHIEIMPKLVKIAGFEWGSGFYINPVPPNVAAEELMKIKVKG